MYAATGNGVVKIGHGKTKKLSSQLAIKNSYTLFKENKKEELFVMNFQNQIYRVQEDSLELYIDLRQEFSERIFSYQFLNGYLYVNSSRTIKRYNANSLTPDRDWDQIQTNKKQLYFESIIHNDTIFLGDRYLYGDSVYSSAENAAFIYPKKRSGGRVIHYHNNKYYAINQDQMILYQKGKPSVSLAKYFEKKERANHIGSLYNDLWISTSSGVLIFDPENLDTCKLKIFNDIPVSHIKPDYQGNIWIATLGNGIRVIPHLDAKCLTFNDDLLVDFKIKPNTKNEFYVAKNNGEILHYNKTIRPFWKTKNPINGIFPIDDTLYVSTNSKLYRVYNNHVDSFPINEKIDHFYANKNYYIGSSWYSVSVFNKDFKRSEVLKFPYPLHQKKKYAAQILLRGISPIWVSPENDIAVGSEFGKLKIIEHDSIKLFSKETALWNVANIHISNTGEVFVLFTNGKVYQLSKDGRSLSLQVEFDTTEKPNKIYTNKNFIVIYTTHELFTYNRITKETAVFKGLSHYAHEGIVNFQMSETHVHLCTKNKLYSIPIGKLNKKFLVYDKPLKLKVDNHYISPENYNNIPPGFHTLHVNINHFDEISSNQILLSYRLNNGPWVEAENISKEIVLNQLAFGDYDMEVRIQHGSQDEHTKSLSFSVSPYWYQTKLFFSISILLTALVFGVWIRKLKQKIKIDRELNRAQLTAINAQMKPHFIFNVLNGLQHFILKEDKLQANKIIGEFSRFIRKILDVSKEEMITLEKEIEIIQSYLHLEKIRFKDKFDVQINTEECTIEVLHTLIPPLLIQPYVENAINHGLLHKNKGGILKIDFKIEGSRLICTIEDNGVGRERASQIEQNKKQHSSFYSDANIKRMDLIKGGEVIVIDKVDEDGNALGTIIILKTTLVYE